MDLAMHICNAICAWNMHRHRHMHRHVSATWGESDFCLTRGLPPNGRQHPEGR